MAALDSRGGDGQNLGGVRIVRARPIPNRVDASIMLLSDIQANTR